ncbi:MAG: hypothetical protein NVS3B10_09910 [Polyangiales bacterium]
MTLTVLAGASATPYCGTFAGDANGVWNFVVNASTVSGSAVDSKGNGDTLNGTVDGSGTIALTSKNGTNAPGKIVGSGATGTWANGTAKGTWTGTAGCL